MAIQSQNSSFVSFTSLNSSSTNLPTAVTTLRKATVHVLWDRRTLQHIYSFAPVNAVHLASLISTNAKPLADEIVQANSVVSLESLKAAMDLRDVSLVKHMLLNCALTANANFGKLLIFAAENGDSEMIDAIAQLKIIKENGEEVKLTDQIHNFDKIVQSALEKAILGGHFGAVRAILDCREMIYNLTANLDDAVEVLMNNELIAAIVQAAKDGQHEIISALLNSDEFLIRMPDELLPELLSGAIQKGRLKIVQDILGNPKLQRRLDNLPKDVLNAGYRFISSRGALPEIDRPSRKIQTVNFLNSEK